MTCKGLISTLYETKRKRSWDGIPKRPTFPKWIPTNQHPDSKSGPGASCHLHHEVNVHKDAHQWEKRQSRYLGTKQNIYIYFLDTTGWPRKRSLTYSGQEWESPTPTQLCISVPTHLVHLTRGCKNTQNLPWLVWLSGFSASLWTKVAGLIPSQDTSLRCASGPQQGAFERQPHLDVSLPLFLSSLTLSKNK